jgi:hypothetical protein
MCLQENLNTLCVAFACGSLALACTVIAHILPHTDAEAGVVFVSIIEQSTLTAAIA